MDFRIVKQCCKEIVDRLNEKTLIPALSDCLKIQQIDEQIHIRYEDDTFSLPAKDVCLLPIVRSSAEELAQFIWRQLQESLQSTNDLHAVDTLEISVAESPGQAARYRAPLSNGK